MQSLPFLLYRYANSASGSQYAPRPSPAVVSLQCRARGNRRYHFAATDKIENRNAMERIVEFPTDRTVISTENNGFAGDERDETLIDENLVETEIPLADRIPGAVRETEEGDRPIYDEEGHRNDPGGE